MGSESESPVLRTGVIWKSGWWWVSNRLVWLLELLTELIKQIILETETVCFVLGIHWKVLKSANQFLLCEENSDRLCRPPVNTPWYKITKNHFRCEIEKVDHNHIHCGRELLLLRLIEHWHRCSRRITFDARSKASQTPHSRSRPCHPHRPLQPRW